jgi:hypothetical protein
LISLDKITFQKAIHLVSGVVSYFHTILSDNEIIFYVRECCKTKVRGVATTGVHKSQYNYGLFRLTDLV